MPAGTPRQDLRSCPTLRAPDRQQNRTHARLLHVKDTQPRLAHPAGRQIVKEGRIWIYPRLRIPVEIPGNVLNGDLGRVLQIDLGDGLRAYVIGIDDLILDRVDQAFAQGSPVSDVRRQSLLLLGTYWEKLDWDYLKRESERRGTRDYLGMLVRELGKVIS